MLDSENINRLLAADTTLFWFRRDLRLTDNASLFHALQKGNVVPLFIFDTTILDDLKDKADSRVTFIADTLEQLRQELEKAGSSLITFRGNPIDFFQNIQCAHVFANEDYEPAARKRDKLVAEILAAKNISFHLFKDQVIFGPEEVLKDDGLPYTIYTPYSRKWKARLALNPIPSYPSESIKGFKALPPQLPITPESVGFQRSTIELPPRKIKIAVIDQYDQSRNFPSKPGTTRLGLHLRFGTVSIRKLAEIALAHNEVWLNELIWREFYFSIIWHFPHVVTKSFKPAYDRIEWRNDLAEFQRWCTGQTGYPIVDAGMRELNTTGFMHNRVRMITASFLTKHLLIDWRWGEAYFASKLLDFDLAANNGGWQWAAGCGCDAAPYFRVFNPTLQTAKFDPDFQYIATWVPEWRSSSYPKPMVDHAFARARALEVYKLGLNA